MIKMLKGQKKHIDIDKEQDKTKHEAPRCLNYRATQNKNNIGTTALERSNALIQIIQYPCSQNGLLPVSDFLKMVNTFEFRFLGKTYKITSLERKRYKKLF